MGTCSVLDSMQARKIPVRVTPVVQSSGDNGTPPTQGLSTPTLGLFPGGTAALPRKNLGFTPEPARDLVGSRKPCVMILGSAPPSVPVATTTTIIITTTTTIIITITITITKPMITFSVMTVLVKTTSSDGPHSRRPRHLSAWILALK